MFQLPATATLAQASDLVRQIEAALAAPVTQGEALAIDASALEACDTSALAVLLHARRLAQAAGRGFEVRGAPAKLVQLAQLYGVAELLALVLVPAPQTATA